MSFTQKQVEAAMDSEDFQVYAEEEFGYGTVWEGIAYESGDKPFDVPGIGQVVKVDYWGGEGDGAGTYLVFKVIDTDQLFQKSGTYSSWDSNYWEGPLVEVEPYVEPKTYYRRKKQA